MNDQEREQHIRDCGVQMQRAMLAYQQSGCLSDRGEADRFRLLMEEAIRGRSPEYVARLETERGLA